MKVAKNFHCSKQGRRNGGACRRALPPCPLKGGGGNGGTGALTYVVSWLSRST